MLPHPDGKYSYDSTTSRCKIESRVDIIVNELPGTDLGKVNSVSDCLKLTKAARFTHTLLKNGRCIGTNNALTTLSTSCNLQLKSGEEGGDADNSFSVYSSASNSFTLSKDSENKHSITAIASTIEESHFMLKI